MGPLEYIHRPGLAPRMKLATPHWSDLGTTVPPSSGGTDSRHHSASISARYDFLNDSGIVTSPVAGSKTGGLRSLSTNESATGPSGEPVDLGQHVPRGFLVNLGERPGPEDFLAAEYFEQVELDVPEIALVVAHVTLRLS